MTTFAKHKYFESLAFVICLIYIISQAFDDVERTAHPANIIHLIDYVTAILLIGETALRLHSLRHVFLLNIWNFIDAIIVIFLIIGKSNNFIIQSAIYYNIVDALVLSRSQEFAVYEFTHSHLIPIGLLRVARIARFNSIITSLSPSLSQALKSLNQSKYVAYQLGLFLFLVTLVYGMIGVVAFGRIAHIFPINENVSFYRLGRSMVLLLQISTSAGWDGVYIALIKHYNPFLIALYVLSYMIICIFITINLVLTGVLNYYSSCVEKEESAHKLCQRDLADFNEIWHSLAQLEHPIFMKKDRLVEFLKKLDAASSLRTAININEENVRLLGIPLHEEQTYYRGDVLIALNKARLRQASH